MRVLLKRLRDDAVVPKHGSDLAAGYDLYACIDEPVVIEPHKTVLIPTGWAIKPPAGYYIAVVARSGLAVKEGLRLANCYAVCDEDYRGEYFVPLHNDSKLPRTIHKNERIAQMLLKQYDLCEFEVVTELDETERGTGGFGSTGTLDMESVD